MDVRQIPLFSMITQQMDWLTTRQKVLAQNIANADTPNYQAKDLAPLDFSQMARAAGDKLKLDTTKGGHINAGLSAGGSHKVLESKENLTSPSGNGVVLEDQLTKVSETQADYELITRLYRKHMGMLRTALGRN
jgi:flagellar basal-body rod protein FlgB